MEAEGGAMSNKEGGGEWNRSRVSSKGRASGVCLACFWELP